MWWWSWLRSHCTSSPVPGSRPVAAWWRRCALAGRLPRRYHTIRNTSHPEGNKSSSNRGPGGRTGTEINTFKLDVTPQKKDTLTNTITETILQLNHTDHVMGVRDPHVLVKPLLGWKKPPIGPKFPGATFPRQLWRSPEVSGPQRWWSHSEEVRLWSPGTTLLDRCRSESGNVPSTAMLWEDVTKQGCYLTEQGWTAKCI